MFESAEIGHKIGRKEYEAEAPALRQELLSAQYELLEKKGFPVVILVNGVDGAGKGETVNLLNEWMDPRHILTHAFGEASDEELERPPMWRFWRALPPKGRIGILFGSWYTDPILGRVEGGLSAAAFEQQLAEIRRMERMLVAEGALLLKLWFHLPFKEQKRRLRELWKDKDTRWRVAPTDWKRLKRAGEFRDVCERALRETSSGEAPWTVIEGTDPRYRYLTVGRVLLSALKARLSETGPRPSTPEPPAAPAALDGKTVLSQVDYEQKLTRKEYDSRLERYQGSLSLLTRRKTFRERSLLLVFEGMDAAGKGSTIRRITAALDARHYGVVPIAAPSEEERAQPYLWRFWRQLPRRGRVTIFDRSWYGRVLVERVEGFCSETDFRRAYHEINDFEEQLARAGAVVLKFWLTITKEEQLRRFREREKTPWKTFKITAEDWRNREKWPAYEAAVEEMLARTSTEIAPWTVIPANDKLFARVAVLKTISRRLEKALGA